MNTPISPRSALSPRVMLATAMHSQPGVYALLLGSGVSTGAGVPTGWGVVTDLVQKIAVAQAPEDAESLAKAAADPETWAAEHGIDVGYSALLGAMAPSASGRQALLAGYFTPSEQERQDGKKVPSPAHRAIAKLVERGAVQVIVTTNFDSLMEQALVDVGVEPQVISRASTVAGMQPLAHARCTVIKLHGDYRELDTRNTVDELAVYPPEWDALLGQVVRDYGLLVSGWSAQYDIALRAALAAAPMRYQLFWDARSAKGEHARALLAQHRGTVVPAASADALFEELWESVEALDRMAEAPLTTALAVARLKRALPDPVRRIELHDLVMGAVDQAVSAIERIPSNAPADADAVDAVLQDLVASTAPLLHLLIEGVYHDIAGEHTALWCDALLRLMNAYRYGGYTFWVPLQHYPAVLALYAMGIVAIERGRPGVLLELLTGPRWRGNLEGRKLTRPAHVLNVNRVLDKWINQLPRWGEGFGRWQYPMSQLIRTDLEPVFAGHLSGAEISEAFDDVEYFIGLVQALKPEQSALPFATGAFNDDSNWVDADRVEMPAASLRLEERIKARGADELGIEELFGGREPSNVLDEHCVELEQRKTYR